VIDVSKYRPLPFEGRYLWHPQPPDAEVQKDYLPPDVFEALTGHIDRGPRVAKLVKSYTSESAAWRALADAIDATRTRSVTTCPSS
jgi:hypothetical protein